MSNSSNDSKHTPGPWRIEGAGHMHAAGSTALMHENYCIAVFRGVDSDANARLIAAAPDMLDALRLALDYCESGAVEDSIPGTLSETIRAAIAAATGVTP